MYTERDKACSEYASHTKLTVCCYVTCDIGWDWPQPCGRSFSQAGSHPPQYYHVLDGELGFSALGQSRFASRYNVYGKIWYPPIWHPDCPEPRRLQFEI
jgi:hypothetical protein